MPSNPTPKPGDVIFIYSSGKESVISGFVQRVIFPSDNILGPWFSHVAIALSDQIAFEASTPAAEDDPPTWSGVTPEGGARLILLPDLLIPAKRRAILRHPHAATIAQSKFDMSSRHIAGLYGSSYAIQALRESFEEAVPILAKLIPASQFDWFAPADRIAEDLRGNPEFKAKILEKLGDGSFASVNHSFFCSQFVMKILGYLGLFDENEADRNITPCALYDRLITQEWIDVTGTDYPDEVIGNWVPRSKSDWQTTYTSALASIKFWRAKYPESAALEILSDTFRHQSNKLDDTIGKLIERYRP